MLLSVSNIKKYIGKLHVGSPKPKLIHNFNFLRHKRSNNVQINYLEKKFCEERYDVEAIRNKLFQNKIFDRDFDYDEDGYIIRNWLKKNATLISTVTDAVDTAIKKYKYKNQDLTVIFFVPWMITIETGDIRVMSEIQKARNEFYDSR